MVAGMIFCGLSSFLFFERLFLIIWKLLSKKKKYFLSLEMYIFVLKYYFKVVLPPFFGILYIDH